MTTTPEEKARVAWNLLCDAVHEAMKAAEGRIQPTRLAAAMDFTGGYEPGKVIYQALSDLQGRDDPGQLLVWDPEGGYWSLGK